jgi:hypothetical protein
MTVPAMFVSIVLSPCASIASVDEAVRQNEKTLKIKENPDLQGCCMYWCRQRDLNPHGFPHDFESRASANSAIPASVTSGKIKMVGKTGFEPATSWSRTKRSTKLSHFPTGGEMGSRLYHMACPERFELPTF